VFPSKKSILKGESAEFVCLSNQEVQWDWNGQSLPQTAIEKRANNNSLMNILLINKARLNDAGTYSCSLYDQRELVFRYQVILEVNGNVLTIASIAICVLCVNC